MLSIYRQQLSTASINLINVAISVDAREWEVNTFIDSLSIAFLSPFDI